MESIIDCSAAPFIPRGWSIRPGDQLESRFMGELIWDPKKIAFHLEGRSFLEKDLLKELVGQLVMPANVLDHILKPEERQYHSDYKPIIPKEWNGWYKPSRAVFFWGTIYRNENGKLCVRCLAWDCTRWIWSCCWLEGDWWNTTWLVRDYCHQRSAAILKIE